MTSYTQSDYYFNKIDALSCKNRPISSTLRSKSTFNVHESQTDVDTVGYDIYGNQEYNDGSSCDDSYKQNQRSTSPTSNAGNYNELYYCNYYNPYCKNVITADNLMYHRDACSGDSSDRYDIYSTLDYGDNDNLRGESLSYGSNNELDGNDRQLASLGDSNNKMLPQVTQMQQSQYLWMDGMYCSGQHRQSNVSLPSTATFRYNDSSSVGGREMVANNCDWDRGFIANGVKTQRHNDLNGGGLNGHRPPERILPLPQSQSYVKKSLKQQFFRDTLDDMATTTTSSTAYRNPISFEFKKAMPVSSADQNLPSRTRYYDNGGITEQQQLSSQEESNYNNFYNTYDSRYTIEPRPHTSMQTTEEYNEFALNSLDNMSTYSDSTVPTGATTYANQQKLQDMQKCRYSLIMAMTTASVIASGETRIPQHLLKKTPKTSASTATGLDASMTINNSYSCDNSSGSNTKINNLTSCAYTNVTNQSLVNLLPTAASPSMLMLSSASPIVAADGAANTGSNTNSTMTSSNAELSSGLSLTKNFTSRKLPKHHTGRGGLSSTSKQLPQSPQYSFINTSLLSKTLPVTPQTSSLQATTDTLDNIKTASSILSTTLPPTTTSSSVSSTFSLLSHPGSTTLASSSFIKPETKTNGITAGTSTTTESDLFPNNNNTELNMEIKNYENFNNYKNNNFFSNNAQNSGDKFSIESIDVGEKKAAAAAEEESKEKSYSKYHPSTTPSRLSSLESPTDKSSYQSSHQFLTGTAAYDSFLNAPVTTTTLGETTTASITTTTASTLETSNISTSKSILLMDTDRKPTYDFDINDYLKPYTLPTIYTSSNSNNTNLQYTLSHTDDSISSSSYLPYASLDFHSGYLTFSSSIITDTSTTLSTTLTSSLSITSETTTTSTILAINNRELDKITALNLSDNISRKSSISSPVSKITSPSGSAYYPIPPISCSSTTLATLTSSNLQQTSAITTKDLTDQVSLSCATQVQHEEKDKSKISLDLDTQTKTDHSSPPLYVNSYDNYLKDFKLDFGVTSSELSSVTHTLATTTTTASSLALNKSWPTSTMSTTLTTTDNTINSLNNNEIAADDTSTGLSSFAPACLLTTTKTTAPSGEIMPTKNSYTDYLKDYSTVTASSSTSFVSDVVTDKASTELPAYIMDFLMTSKSNEFDSSNYLNLYKIKDDTTMDIFTSDISSSSLKTTNNNNLLSNSESFLTEIPTTTTIPDTKDFNKVASVVEEEPLTQTIEITKPTTLPAIVTFTTSSPTHISPELTTTENQLTANTALNSMVDFDDSFYSSFSVNLNSLMGDTTAATTADNNFLPKQYHITEESVSAGEKTSSIDTLADNTSKSLFATSADIAKTTTTSVKSVEMARGTTEVTMSSTQSFVPSSQPSSSTEKPLISGSKATSMLGGLSQSLKGGLDGVLAAAGGSEPQQQKRGFGFGLASKFVPSVGGLLGSSSTKSTAPSSTAANQIPKTAATAVVISKTTQQNLVSSEPLKSQVDAAITTASVTSQNNVTSSLSDGYFYDAAATSGNIIITTSDNKNTSYATAPQTYDICGNETDGSGSGGIYYNSSQTTYYHMTSSVDYAQDEMANHAEQMMIYDDAVTGDYSDMKNGYYVDENQAIDMYDGYSEYSSVATSGHLIDSTAYMSVTTSGHFVDTPASIAYPATSGLVQAISSSPAQSSNSATVSAAKKATSSLFSSLTNVASQISSQTSSSGPAAATSAASAITSGSKTQTTSTKPSSGGGMFGSIFGKAAAAMQTATQVVNQGASMASTKVQKNLQPSSAPSVVTKPSSAPLTEQPATCAMTTTGALTDNSYQRNTISQQNSLASPYASSLGGGDDYDNSNIPHTDEEFDHQLQEEDYYYINQNQPVQPIHQQSQQKILPTVLPGGGSTGKKLPTINDKSGCLVKQQPTEIYDDDSQVLENKSQSYLTRVPSYNIDSEQADYYMDTQPVAPSARHMAVNGYYEHTNGGSYDYRDDYFNEEDELNYLEKEEILDNKQQQQQLRQIHKQSSVQYAVDDDFPPDQNEIDEYIEDMYHSEDSGNYLDESSSGSVKGLHPSHQQIPATTIATSSLQTKSSTAAATVTTTMSGSTTAHQQIKKQDSIILEEEEKEDHSSRLTTDPTASPSKSLSRKSSYDILDDEDDQIGDLQKTSPSFRSSQSRKMKLMRGETEEVVGGHMQIMKRKTEVTAKQRWHWAYNKIIMQLNVSRTFFILKFKHYLGVFVYLLYN